MISELVLLTRHYCKEELICWLNWHLNIIGADRISVIDNDSSIDVKSICDSFPDSRVSYEQISGTVKQYDVYNNKIKAITSNWVMALDDDEFLYVSDKYDHNINKFLKYFYSTYGSNKCYIMWLNMYSKERMQCRNGLFINDHIYYSYEADRELVPLFKQSNGYGKTFFRNEDGLEYFYRLFGGRWIGHSPKCLNGNDELRLTSGEVVDRDWLNWINDFNRDCFIAHYQYKNKEEWDIKCDRPVIACPTASISNRKYVYDRLYDYADTFVECTLLKDLWNNYRN